MAVRFELDVFERAAPEGPLVLLDLGGRWTSPNEFKLGKPELLVDDGTTIRRLEPLPDPRHPPRLGRRVVHWRVHYVVPRELFDGPRPSRFALQGPGGQLLPLPEPSPKTEPSSGYERVPAWLRPRPGAQDPFLALGTVLVVLAVALAALGLAATRPALLPVLGLTLAAAVFLVSRPGWIVPAFIALTWASLPAGIFGGLPSPVETGGLILLVLATWYAVARLDLAREVLVVLALLALPLLISGMTSSDGLIVPSDQLKDLTFLAIGALCVRGFAGVDRAVVALALVAVFLGLGAISSVLVGPTDLFPLAVEPEGVIDPEAPRAAGPFGEPNFFALSLATITPFALYLIPQGRWRRLLGIAALLSILGGVLAAGSRGGLLAVGLAITAVVLLSQDRRLRIAAVTGVLAAAALVPLFSSQVESFSGRDVSGRTTENQIAVAMLEDHPLTGVGPGRYVDNYRDYSRQIGNDPRPRRAAHSLPLEIAAEQGMLGVIGWALAFITLLGFALSRGIWHWALGKAVVLSIATYLAGSLFLHGSLLRLLYLLLGLALALAASAPQARGGQEARWEPAR